ncbi:MAG: ABC transporter ATP-binding protein [Chloroflexi bacterium]|nr:ABC transporter ATP-binding protein [Chloroflexota bacterium]
MTPTVSLQNVTKTFNEGEQNQVVALQDITLDIAPGEFVSVIGPSGCGKSTLLRLVGDLIGPSYGRVLVNNKPAPQARLDQDYGIVFQSPTLYEWRTVSKNVQLPLELRGLNKIERESRAQEMLSLVELTGFENHHPWQLSGGMQQRVSIARALAMRPQLLLMDEPFGALDEMTRERMNMELHTIWEDSNKTIIFITHSIAEAVFMSTRVVIMSARPGRLIQDIKIDLPRHRTAATREDTRYFSLVNQVRESLREAEAMSA